MSSFRVLLCTFLLAACGGGRNVPSRDGAADGPPQMKSPDGSSSTSGGPIVQSFTVTPTAAVINDSLTFSLIATDSAGVSALTGAVLLDADTQATYGSFATPGGQGTFELDLSWMQLVSVEPLDEAGSRSFEAQLFDEAGHTATASVTVAFQCPAVGGVCSSDAQCACGQQCDNQNNVNYRCCVPPDGACSTDADCCDYLPGMSSAASGYGYSCVSGTCQGHGWFNPGYSCIHSYDCQNPGAVCPGNCP